MTPAFLFVRFVIVYLAIVGNNHEQGLKNNFSK
jgi:hypothetical protein